MMGDFFWDVATSFPALGIDGLLLLAAAVVGWFPLLKYLPGIGAYVPAARLVAALVALLMFFLIGFRVADEREAAKLLRAQIAVQRADLENSRKSALDEAKRAGDIEAMADDQRKRDHDYIISLEAKPGCVLTDRDLVWVPNYGAKSGRPRPSRGSR